MAHEEGFLLPGTVMKHLVIYHKKKQTEKPSAEVMYSAPLPENGDFKIGIQWTANASKRFALGRKGFSHALRPVRHTLSNLRPDQKTIHFSDHNALYCSGVLKNISDYGLAFELKTQDHTEDLFLKLGDTLDPFEVRVNGAAIYNGKVTVEMLQPNDGKVIVGVSLGERCEKFHDVIGQEGKTGPANGAPLYLNLNRINKSFKALLADLRYVLETVKEAMDKEEKQISHEGTVHRGRIEKIVIERFEPSVFHYLDDAMKCLNLLVLHLDTQAHVEHRDYFQKQLGAILCQSPFVKRSYTKPLGYAGDYEMMAMLYRNAYEGETFFAKLLNKYFSYHIRPAAACRNRIPFLLKKIEQAAEKRSQHGKKTRILSLACGPANEVVEFISHNEMSNHTEITLIDIEPEALYTTQETILEARERNGRHTKVHIYYLPLKQLLTEAKAQPHLNNQDLIYCVGLFDYLTNPIFQKTMKTLYEMLHPTGTLVVGNFDPSNEMKTYMEYGLEWHLIYRTQADMIQLTREAIGPLPRILCESEQTGINNFLVVQK
jgi:extracellular factor (EF) 3-hydroxypalmitic acid methyl ester biosynthesis protein